MKRAYLSRGAQLCTLLGLVGCLAASPHHRGSNARWNLPLPTLGGTQFWSDVGWRSGWKIQENVVTGHHRLLDRSHVRRAWGGLGHCRAVLDQRVSDVEPVEHLVVLLHGLGRSWRSMVPLAEAIESSGLEVATLTYASTRAGFDDHVRKLTQLLNSLENVSRVSFVTHSFGGLVLRGALAVDVPWRHRIALGRVVQLAPPNRGSSLARRLRRTPVRWFLGPCLETVASSAPSSLPAPPCEFAVLAGGMSNGSGWNALIEGDDDGIVGVAETVMDGASLFLIVRELHTFLMQNEEVIQSTLRFLRDELE